MHGLVLFPFLPARIRRALRSTGIDQQLGVGDALIPTVQALDLGFADPQNHAVFTVTNPANGAQNGEITIPDDGIYDVWTQATALVTTGGSLIDFRWVTSGGTIRLARLRVAAGNTYNNVEFFKGSLYCLAGDVLGYLVTTAITAGNFDGVVRVIPRSPAT